MNLSALLGQHRVSEVLDYRRIGNMLVARVRLEGGMIVEASTSWLVIA